MRCLVIAVVCAGLAAGPASAVTAQSACRDAVDKYNSTMGELFYALKRYSTCISNSRGTDDCYSEFSRVRGAQSDFESAVSSYKSECNQ